DDSSLAAFDDQAYVIFKAFVPPSDPRSTADSNCNPASTDYNPSDTECHLNNVTTLLIYRPATGDFVTQYTLDGDGRGLGGHRFVKAYSVSEAACNSLEDNVI